MMWWEKFRQLNPPVKWLLGFIFGVLVLAFAFAPRPQPVDISKISFNTTSDSRLYFQNIRSFYYNIDALSKKPMIIYKLKRRKAAEDSMSLQFSIIQHPLTDNAFAYAELGGNWKQYDSLYVEFTSFKGELLGHLSSEAHYRIAAKVYSSLLEGKPVYLLSANDTLRQLYTNEQARINAEITLEDFFRLTNKN